MASMKTNMAGLMRWHRNNPRKRLGGYFTVDGKLLTHNQVLAVLEYAIEHNCKTEQDIPSDIVEKIVNGEIVPKKGGKRYYFTFGVGIDKPHRNCYHVIEADSYEAARDEMVNRFGLDWAFQYSEEQWKISKEKYDLMKNWRTVGEWHEGYTQAELFNLEEI